MGRELGTKSYEHQQQRDSQRALSDLAGQKRARESSAESADD
jgi:hypothetical protein